MKIFHVSKKGNDKNIGNEEYPFLSISKAAQIMSAGDKVIVHEGVYREWVSPNYSGDNNNKRITYEAKEGEKVCIKGSEIIKGWTQYKDSVWTVTLPNSFFGSYNPYAEPLQGDWLLEPSKYHLHTGEVYLNGKSFYETQSIEQVLNPEKRFTGPSIFWSNKKEYLLHPEDSIYQWYCEADEKETTIWANFHEYDPNTEEVEINVRPFCFFPKDIKRNYITVRGFEIAQAATQWAPPTTVQSGIIGPNWAQGWIIENNIIHDSKCSGIALGKERSTLQF
ncbi:MAG: hypothetical protein GX903_02250 [Spirochaetales bacterium]|nr:hypothetical protein [Spirochaetales bacterium]